MNFNHLVLLCFTAHGHFSEDEICTGEPQRMAKEHHSTIGRELAPALDPHVKNRPNALVMKAIETIDLTIPSQACHSTL